MKDGLKPCPMCGGKAHIDSGGLMDTECCWVACMSCGTTGPMVHHCDYTIRKTDAQLEAIARRKWNRRVK